MKTPTPQPVLEDHAAFLAGINDEIKSAKESGTSLDFDELITEPPACDDGFDVVSLATEVNLQVWTQYLEDDFGYDVEEFSPLHDAAKSAAWVSVELTIALIAKSLNVDKYLLWSTVMAGKKIHAPTVHLYDDGELIWADGRTKEQVSPPE